MTAGAPKETPLKAWRVCVWREGAQFVCEVAPTSSTVCSFRLLCKPLHGRALPHARWRSCRGGACHVNSGCSPPSSKTFHRSPSFLPSMSDSSAVHVRVGLFLLLDATSNWLFPSLCMPFPSLAISSPPFLPLPFQAPSAGVAPPSPSATAAAAATSHPVTLITTEGNIAQAALQLMSGYRRLLLPPAERLRSPSPPLRPHRLSPANGGLSLTTAVGVQLMRAPSQTHENCLPPSR